MGGIIFASHLGGAITAMYNIFSSGGIQCIRLRILRAAAVVTSVGQTPWGAPILQLVNPFTAPKRHAVN